MKLNKLILITSAILLGTTGAFADDFDSFDDFGSFGGDSSSGSATKLEVNGTAKTDIRAYVDTSDKDDKDGAEKIDINAIPSASLDLKYSGNKSDLELKLKLDETTIKNNPVDVIDEAVIRGYFNNLTLEAGKMKIVWGKGDKLHVLDNFNADDYSDFIIPDYLDRRISTPMIRAVYSLPVANINIEGVYTPFLPVDRFATNGRWTPAQVGVLTGTVTQMASGKVADAFTGYTKASGMATAAGIVYQSAGEAYKKAAAAYQANPLDSEKAATFAASKTAFEAAQAEYEQATATLHAAGAKYMYYLTNASALSSNKDVIYPNTQTLKYGQFGGRVTATLGQVDLGLSYYNGWFKQPTINQSKMDGFLDTYLATGSVSDGEKFLTYDKKQTFGLEASTTIWHFNLRGEAAYNLTKDTDGTDPYVQNNSVAWLGGFDIDLPFWNANLNVQETGTYVLQDTTNNKIVANITTSFANDKLAPEVTVMYGVENKDLVVMPKFAFKPDQNLTLTASGMYIWCGDDNSEFKAWENNSFVNLGVSYQF